MTELIILKPPYDRWRLKVYETKPSDLKITANNSYPVFSQYLSYSVSYRYFGHPVQFPQLAYVSLGIHEFIAAICDFTECQYRRTFRKLFYQFRQVPYLDTLSSSNFKFFKNKIVVLPIFNQL